MDERKIDLSALGIFAVLLSSLQRLKIPFIYFQDEDGSFFCGCEVMTVHGTGATLGEAVNDLVEALRDVSECYYEDLPYWAEKNPRVILYVLKIMMCNDEEIKKCLTGEESKDF